MNIRVRKTIYRDQGAIVCRYNLSYGDSARPIDVKLRAGKRKCIVVRDFSHIKGSLLRVEFLA